MESHRAHVGTGITFPPGAGEVGASRRCRGHAPTRGKGAAPPGSPRPAELRRKRRRRMEAMGAGALRAGGG